MISIVDISGNPELTNQFVDFGVDFPKQFPNTIPKFRQSEANLLNPQINFFFNRGGIFKGFIALENKNIVGRIAAMINPEIMDDNGETPGLIGLFECIENYDVAKQLIDAAIFWLKTNAIKKSWGPFDFSIWHSYRFQTSGFDEKPYIGEPRNPPYYPAFFEKYGFKPTYDWQSRTVDIKGLYAICKNYKDHFDLFERMGYEIIYITKNCEQYFMELAYELFIDSYKVFTGFTTLSKKDFLQLYKYVPMLLDKEATFFLKNPKGEYIGFLLVLKDLTKALIKMNGQTDLKAKLKYFLYRNNSEFANIYQGGLKISAIREAMKEGKEKLGQPLSLGRASIFKCFDTIIKSRKYKYAIFPLMRENAPNRNYSEGHYIKMRTHHLFEISI